MRRAGAESPPDSPDWPEIVNFLQEVQREEEPGDPTWLDEFGGFRDLVDILRTTLRLTGPIRRQGIEKSLMWELRANTDSLVRRLDGERALPAHSVAPQNVPNLTPGSSVIADSQLASRLMMFRMMWPRRGALNHAALDEAIRSGELLDFDVGGATPVVGAKQQLLLRLRETMDGLESLLEVADTSPVISRDIAAIAARAGGSDVETSAFTHQWFYAIGASLENVLRLHAAVAQFLDGAPARIPRLRPGTPDEDEVQRIRSENPSAADVDNVLLDPSWIPWETTP